MVIDGDAVRQREWWSAKRAWLVSRAIRQVLRCESIVSLVWD
jgi:hypothetical protein